VVVQEAKEMTDGWRSRDYKLTAREVMGRRRRSKDGEDVRTQMALIGETSAMKPPLTQKEVTPVIM
jgi:hypothetical protein